MKRFLMGALLGAGVALLYAPATGRRTRSLIRDKAGKITHDVQDFAESKGRHLANEVEGYKSRARRMGESFRERVGGRNEQDTPMIGESAV